EKALRKGGEGWAGGAGGGPGASRQGWGPGRGPGPRGSARKSPARSPPLPAIRFARAGARRAARRDATAYRGSVVPAQSRETTGVGSICRLPEQDRADSDGDANATPASARRPREAAVPWAHDTPPRMHRPITCEVIDRRLGMAETSGCARKCAVCEEAKMSEFNDLVERYIAVWNEVDPDRRQRLIAETFSEGASYIDPLITGEGH